MGEIRAAVLHGRGFHLVRGIPLERWSVRQCAIAYFGLGTLLGEPVSQNAMGHILGHVKDIGAEYARPEAPRIPDCGTSSPITVIPPTSSGFYA